MSRSVSRRLAPVGLGIAASLLAVAVVAGPSRAAHVMFVTSITGTGDLSSWDDAGGFAGLAAGDAICQAIAGRANLGNSGAYRAWLSDSSNDAYCRLSGLSGKVSAKCGQAVLPADAGPWQRTDGQPFAGTIGELAAGVVYTVANLDQSGAFVPGGTLAAGTDTSGGWSQGSYPACSTLVRLSCFESGAGPDLAPSTAKGVPAFVTDATGSGDLSSWPDAGENTGLAAADEICRTAAANAGLYAPAFYRAWLSATGANVASRITGGGPWVRLDGIEIASSHAALTGGLLEEPFNVTESRQYVGALAWTGSSLSGVVTANTCVGWKSSGSGDKGMSGVPDNRAFQWTQGGDISCDASQHLYCVCDQTLIASDGFESGDLTGWSSSQP